MQEVERSPSRAQGFSNSFQEVFVTRFTCFHVLPVARDARVEVRIATATTAAAQVATGG